MLVSVSKQWFPYVIGADDPDYDKIRPFLDFLPSKSRPPLSLFILRAPEDLTLSNDRLSYVKYCLNKLISRQRCRTIGGRADAETFFSQNLVTGAQILHILAHLATALLQEEYPLVGERFFSFKNYKDQYLVVFSVELDVLFGQKFCQLHEDLYMLFGGRAVGEISRLLSKQP